MHYQENNLDCAFLHVYNRDSWSRMRENKKKSQTNHMSALNTDKRIDLSESNAIREMFDVQAYVLSPQNNRKRIKYIPNRIGGEWYVNFSEKIKKVVCCAINII